MMKLRRMELIDLEIISNLEIDLFTSPWKKQDFEYEISKNEFAHYYIVEVDDDIVGYFGLWCLFDQAQITTIGTKKEYQKQGVGSFMMEQLIRIAIDNECEFITLEVRVSNQVAQNLYMKHGFETINIRKDYYKDNHEDAYLMIKPIGGLE